MLLKSKTECRIKRLNNNRSGSNVQYMFKMHMSNNINLEKCVWSYRLGNRNTENKSKIRPKLPSSRLTEWEVRHKVREAHAAVWVILKVCVVQAMSIAFGFELEDTFLKNKNTFIGTLSLDFRYTYGRISILFSGDRSLIVYDNIYMTYILKSVYIITVWCSALCLLLTCKLSIW